MTNKVEQIGRDFGKFKQRTQQKHAQMGTLQNEIKEVRAIVDIFNSTLIQVKKHSSNKISSLDGIISDNSHAIDNLLLNVRNLERKVSLS